MARNLLTTPPVPFRAGRLRVAVDEPVIRFDRPEHLGPSRCAVVDSLLPKES